jgi:hypothetical protein
MRYSGLLAGAAALGFGTVVQFIAACGPTWPGFGGGDGGVGEGGGVVQPPVGDGGVVGEGGVVAPPPVGDGGVVGEGGVVAPPPVGDGGVVLPPVGVGVPPVLGDVGRFNRGRKKQQQFVFGTSDAR